MSNLETKIDNIKEIKQLCELINTAQTAEIKCTVDNNSVIHYDCYDNIDGQLIPKCPHCLVYILVRILVTQPTLIEDASRKSISSYFKTKHIQVRGLISLENLKLLNRSQVPSSTWLKYETLLIHLIREEVYEPKTMASEILATVKDDMEPSLAGRFSSAISGCVKYCRDFKNGNIDEEEKEKWCEIIDWMSWFLAPQDRDDF